MSDNQIGRKFDMGKPRWELLPWEPLKEIVEILTLGAQKYEVGNWKHVSDMRNRYFGALMRHLTAWWEETDPHGKDPESGKSHLAHAGCCLLFLMWNDIQCQKKLPEPLRSYPGEGNE